jgi:hypothetical protein
MGVEVVILNQEYFNEFKNDELFNANMGDFTNNLTGSVMENQMVRMLISVQYDALATEENGMKFTVSGTYYERDQGDWRDDGLAVGDAIAVEFHDSLGVFHGPFFKNITSLSGNIMIVDTTTSVPNAIYNRMRIIGQEPITSLIHSFSLIENSATFGTQNLITGSDSAFYGSGMVAGGGWVNFQGLGQNKDWNGGSFRCRKIVWGVTEQRFEFEHNLLIPFYADGDDLNFLPTYLDGLNSLKYVFKSDFRTVISNPNTSKIQTYESQLGSVAGYGENFNGFDNNYSIKSVDYVDANSSSSASGILISSKTRITIVVDKIVGGFSGTDRYGVYVGYKAEQQDYTNTLIKDFKQNFIYDRSLNSVGLGAVSGGVFITNNTATINGGGDLVIVFDVEYSIADKLFLTDKFDTTIAEFVIGVNVGDITITSGNSDRVMLLAANTLYDKSPDIAGLMTVTKFDIYPHDRQIGVGTPSTNMTSWNEDGLAIDFLFNIDLNLDAFINTLDFKLVAENSVTGEIFELDSYTYPIFGAVVSAGVQQLNISTNRGYILKAGDQFNDIELSTGINIGGNQFYSGRFSQKVSWQSWIENLDVDTIFYDNSKPFNNFNNKSSNYSALNGYDIKLMISANLFGTDAFGTSGLTDYAFLSPAITVYDYTLDGLVPAVWSGVIETFNPATLTNLNLAILTGQNTLFRTTWTNSNGAVVSLTGLYGINRLEESNQLGYGITEMSSLNDPDTVQILIPSSGTKLFMYLNAGNVVLECLIDGAVAGAGTDYNLSSRIHNDSSFVDGKLTSPLSEVKETSGTIETKTESP